MPTPHYIEIAANTIFESLVGATNAQLPAIDLSSELYDIPWDENHIVYKDVKALDASAITEKAVDGNGMFDVFMAGLNAQLTKEYEAGRITGAEYSKAYVALTSAALGNAVQFALGKDAAFWAAVKSQADAITARLNNEVARLQAMLGRANYALTKAKLATEDSAYGNSEFQFSNLLPAQETLVLEQAEAQRAQTQDTRSNGLTPVAGLLKVQKDLYEQQITSYKKDAKLKAGKLFLDSWVTQKTLDDAIRPSKFFNTPQDTGTSEEQANSRAALDDVFRELRLDALDGGEDNFTES